MPPGCRVLGQSRHFAAGPPRSTTLSTDPRASRSRCPSSRDPDPRRELEREPQVLGPVVSVEHLLLDDLEGGQVLLDPARSTLLDGLPKHPPVRCVALLIDNPAEVLSQRTEPPLVSGAIRDHVDPRQERIGQPQRVDDAGAVEALVDPRANALGDHAVPVTRSRRAIPLLLLDLPSHAPA